MSETIKLKVDAIVKVAPEAQLEEKSVNITENGTTEVLPSEGKDGISKLTINTDVDQPLQDKTINITENGEQNVIPDEGFYGLDIVTINTDVQPPLETKEVTQNGTVRPTEGFYGLEEVEVNVQPPLEVKDVSITQNGEQTIETGEDFYGIEKINITTDVQPELEEKTVDITENGETEITPTEGKDGISKVTINTDVKPTRETKTVNVSSNGLTVVPAPTDEYKGWGTININANVQPRLQSKRATTNGTVVPSFGYDGLQSVDVEVQPNLQEKTTTTNGIIKPDEGYDGLSEVNVIVEPRLQDKTVTVTDRFMPVFVTPDDGYDGLASVDIDVSIPINLQNKTVDITRNGTTTVRKTGLDFDGLGTVTINTNVVSPFETLLAHPASYTEQFTYNGSIEIELLPMFEYSSNIKAITLPNARVIPANFCANASALTSVDATPEVIGNYAFFNAKSFHGSQLKTTSLKQIGAQAFSIEVQSGSDGLNGGYRFPQLEQIGDYAFRGSAITMAVAPKIKQIQHHAFYNCKKLNNVDMYGDYAQQISKPTDITAIPAEAFAQCSILTTIIIRAGFFVPLDNTNAFSGCPLSGIIGGIFVPDALVETYKAAANWSSYATKIRPISEYESIVPPDLG